MVLEAEGTGRGETNIMPGNARKLALASFNIRFILFRAAGRISSSASSSLFFSLSLSSGPPLSTGTKDCGVRERWRRDEVGGAGGIEQPIS